MTGCIINVPLDVDWMSSQLLTIFSYAYLRLCVLKTFLNDGQERCWWNQSAIDVALRNVRFDAEHVSGVEEACRTFNDDV